MKTAILQLDAELRATNSVGKGASRRLRRDNKVPAIVYGGKEKPTAITIAQNKIFKALEHEAFYSQILTISINGKQQKTILRDIQRHPYKKEILHMDFQRVSESDVITMKVPLHFINQDTCPGVKEGGIVSHNFIDLNIRCKAKDIPESIDVDLGKLELDNTIHLSDLVLPEGVEIPELALGSEHNLGVVSVQTPKKIEEPALEAESTAEESADKGKEADSSNNKDSKDAKGKDKDSKK